VSHIGTLLTAMRWQHMAHFIVCCSAIPPEEAHSGRYETFVTLRPAWSSSRAWWSPTVWFLWQHLHRKHGSSNGPR